MAYSLEVRDHVERIFEKIAKRDPVQEQAVKKKIKQILEDPYRFKPLKKPLQGKRRVHTFGPFVLVYSINENEKMVVIEDYDHHDKIYR
ncbi:MAG: type II toxin-antitoxin system RelE/ParE family toxin [Candidatus Diapherotrites archaeon]|nr:type II toxin-antitoxin system RelE/ParE family toxin [Candidatus Diapherotrites archaeon]